MPEDVATPKEERIRRIGIGVHELEAGFLMAEGRCQGQGDIRARLQLEPQADRAVAVALAIAADVGVELRDDDRVGGRREPAVGRQQAVVDRTAVVDESPSAVDPAEVVEVEVADT